MELDVFTEDGAAAGCLTVCGRGLMTDFEYIRDCPAGVMRLAAVSPGARLSVGIPAPRGGGMYLKRSFSRAALCGLDPEDIAAAYLLPPDRPLESLPLPSRPAPVPEPRDADVPDAPEDTVPAPEDTGPEDTAPPMGVWMPEPEPEKYFTDPILRQSAAGAAGVMVKLERDDVLLAFPFSPSRPFPMLPAFRYGSAARLEGESYMVFRLREGSPV